MSSSSSHRPQQSYIKLVIVGDGAVGKTSLLISFATNTFPAEYVPTVFDNYSTKLLVNGQAVHLCMWDTAGQEEYDRLRPLSYPDTHIFLVCYSVVNPTSFVNVKSKWLPELNTHCPNAPKLLVATKTDLRDHGETVSRLRASKMDVVAPEQGKRLANELGLAGYEECSAFSQVGLRHVFDQAIYIGLKAQRPVGKKRRVGSVNRCVLV